MDGEINIWCFAMNHRGNLFKGNKIRLGHFEDYQVFTVFGRFR